MTPQYAYQRRKTLRAARFPQPAAPVVRYADAFQTLTTLEKGFDAFDREKATNPFFAALSTAWNQRKG